MDYSKIKYVVSPTVQIARFWMKRKGIDRKVTIITREEQIRGMRFNKDEILIIYGEEYDYPYCTTSFDNILDSFRTIGFL